MQRESLKEHLGKDLKLGSVIKAITRDARKWKAMCSSASMVIEVKEAEEWERQRAAKEADYFGTPKEDSENQVQKNPANL